MDKYWQLYKYSALDKKDFSEILKLVDDFKQVLMSKDTSFHGDKMNDANEFYGLLINEIFNETKYKIERSFDEHTPNKLVN